MKQLLFLLIGFQIIAQTPTTGKITDAETGKPIPYVNIWIENGATGVTSEENGTFALLVPSDKNLVFSAMGYETRTIKLADAQTVKLNPIIFDLDEVVIAKPTREIKLEIGGSKEFPHTYASGQTPWIYAKYFPFTNDYSKVKYIKNAVIFTKSPIKNATFKLRIFEVDANGLPGMDLINEDVVITVKKGKQRNVIDVTKFNITFPNNGIFIAYEWMIIEKNKYTLDFKTLDNKYVTYAPNVVCNPVETENTFNFSGGKWKKIALNDNKVKDYKTVLEPAINLILTN